MCQAGFARLQLAAVSFSKVHLCELRQVLPASGRCNRLQEENCETRIGLDHLVQLGTVCPRLTIIVCATVRADCVEIVLLGRIARCRHGPTTVMGVVYASRPGHID